MDSACPGVQTALFLQQVSARSNLEAELLSIEDLQKCFYFSRDERQLSSAFRQFYIMRNTKYIILQHILLPVAIFQSLIWTCPF